jgi:GrpB-like predicted nucleotidyltransferase (UPF0157 family)
MKLHVSELTPEEFQKAFPIELKDVIPEYAEWYEEAKSAILNVTGSCDVVRINHIGSSAIPAIKAKPMIDILMEIRNDCDVDKLVESLKTIGFGTEVAMRKDNPFEYLLAKGMTVRGFEEKVYLLHIRYLGDWSELYFRDYLLDNPDIAKEYSDLKEQILDDIQSGKIERMPNGQPNGYSMAKLDFVKRISEEARLAYPNRFNPS